MSAFAQSKKGIVFEFVTKSYKNASKINHNVGIIKQAVLLSNFESYKPNEKNNK